MVTGLLSLQTCPLAIGASTCKVDPEGGARVKERGYREVALSGKSGTFFSLKWGSGCLKKCVSRG